jgi:hypothetical protein
MKSGGIYHSDVGNSRVLGAANALKRAGTMSDGWRCFQSNFFIPVRGFIYASSSRFHP